MKFITQEDKNKLFDSLNIDYLKFSIMDFSTFNHKNIKNDLFDKMNTKIFSVIHKTKLTKGYVAPIYIEFVSNEIGYGAFASELIKAGDFIAEYTGVIKCIEKYKPCCSWFYGKIQNEEGQDKSDFFYIDAHSQGNEIRFSNHSDKPNCMAKLLLGEDGFFHICYFAITDIHPESELTVNYGTTYNKDSYHEKYNKDLEL